MLVTGSPTVSDDLGQRLSDSGKDQSPARRFFGAASLQQLSQHLTRRSSSPLGRTTVTTTAGTTAAAAPGSSPRSPASASAVATAPQVVDAHAAGPSGWAKRTPSPPRQGQSTGAAASAAPVASASASGPPADQQQQQQQPHQQQQQQGLMAAAAEPAAVGPQLQPSPVVVMTDAAVAAGSAEASLTQTLAGKRKFLEGTNSTELQYDAHAKSPAHIYDAEQPQQQQQQQGAQLQRGDSNRQRDQQQDEAMPDIPEPVQQQDQQQQQQQQQQKTPPRQDPSPVIEQGSSSPELQQQQQQQQQDQAASPALLQSLQEAGNAPQQQQQQSPQLPAIATHQQQQQQQQQQAGSPAAGESPVSGRQQSNSPGPSSGSGADMKPPSLVDMARRVLGRRPELFGPIDGAYGPVLAGSGGSGGFGSRLGPLRRSQSGNAAATAAAGGGLPPTAPLRTGSHDVSSMHTASMHTASMHAASSHDGAEGAAAGSSLQSEPSLNMGQQLLRQLSSAASLENWLGPGSRTASGSPRSMSAAAERQLLMRSSSNMSTGSGQGSVGRQNSLVLGQQGVVSRGSSLDKQASFTGWPEVAPGVAAAAAAAGGGSFSWPAPAPMRTISEDSLKLDIQMLPAVTPEQYPPEPPPGSAAAEHDGRLAAMHAQQQREQLREQHHTDRAFFAKVAAWEDELVDMLEGQAVPVAIRNIVSVFKDRIHTERDKSEFKALCDKWTGVVEYPAGSGVKCLAIKSWMRGTHAPNHRHAEDTDSDDVGDWDDDSS